jgi:two-component system sensor kinase FixL
VPNDCQRTPKRPRGFCRGKVPLATKQSAQSKSSERIRTVKAASNEFFVTALSDVAKLPDANLKPTQLEDVLRAAVGSGSVDLPSRIGVRLDFPSDLPSVLVDENQIVIAFKNLIRDARDSMASSVSVRLEARCILGQADST